MIKMPPIFRKGSLGWWAATLLLALWLVLQMTGWWYTYQARRMERRIQKLRPTLAAIVLTEQLETARKNCLAAFDEIRQTDIQGSRFLEELSTQTPSSVTLEEVEFHPMLGLKIRGFFFAGTRKPEAVVTLIAKRFSAGGKTFEVRSLSPRPAETGLWNFELKGQ